MIKEFNIIITGVGGQGIITLTRVLAEAALRRGLDVKTSEVHGLSQRMGSVESHVRIGKSIYSPMVMECEANLIIGLEPLEALKTCGYGSKENKTIILFDADKIPLTHSAEKYPSTNQIVGQMKKFSSRVIELNATEQAKKITGIATLANVYLLGYAVSKKLLPIKKKFVLEAIKKIVPEKYFDANKKIFEVAYES